ncbi:MAG: DoxX family protein [Planctomycetes bacterium]|nr:DoxX family protein [Planctomycetota bacterium]
MSIDKAESFVLGRAWKTAALIARLVVGALFIYAASGKISDPMKFAEEVRAYELAPIMTTNAIAITLPWLELFAGVLLIVGLWRTEARLLIFLMMIGFTFGKISVEVRGMDINCGCWGSDWLESTFRGVWGIVLNLFLIGLLLVDYHGQRLTAAPVRAVEPAA